MDDLVRLGNVFKSLDDKVCHIVEVRDMLFLEEQSWLHPVRTEGKAVPFCHLNGFHHGNGRNNTTLLRATFFQRGNRGMHGRA